MVVSIENCPDDDSAKEKKGPDYVGPFIEVQKGLFLAVATFGSDWVHVKKDLTPAYEARFAQADGFCGPLSSVREKGGDRWGFINYEGKLQFFVLPNTKLIANLFDWTMATVESEGDKKINCYYVGWNRKTVRLYPENIVADPKKK